MLAVLLLLAVVGWGLFIYTGPSPNEPLPDPAHVRNQ
jgi:hypothetical protein